MKFNPKPWLKPYIYMNAELGKDAKMIFRNIFQVNEQCSFGKKLWRMLENMEISSLEQPKQEITI